MKKLKANSVLSVFIFGFTLLLLCSFGTDAAYVILSRYKLQKITEVIAGEYAASIPAGNAASSCNDIRNRYTSIYNVTGSGVLVFEIDTMEYKQDTLNNEAVVKVITTSRVVPAFLRFAGVRQIVIHAVACAKTEKIETEGTIGSSGAFDNGSGTYTDPAGAYIEFSAPFEDDTDTGKTAELISAKNTGTGDFSITYKYSDTSGMGSGGGFFILGGYEADGSVRWLDIGDRAMLSSPPYRICTGNSTTNCYYCINASSGGAVSFDLGTSSELEGQAKRLSALRIYKAAGSGALDENTGAYSDPCDPSFIDNDGNAPYYDYFNRDAAVKLTVFSSINLIKLSEYNSYEPENQATGACEGG